MKRTISLLIALAALLAAPAFAAEKKAVKEAPKKEEAKPKEEAKVEPKKEEPKKEEVKKEEAKPQETPAPKEEAKKEGEEKASKKEGSHKSNGLATTLAFIPGIAVHGAGHMYAGAWMKGLGLFAIEGASVAIGLNTYNAGANDLEKITNNKNGSIPTSVGESYGRIGILLVCTAGFLYTWFDDMAGASTSVDVYNKKSDAAAQMGFQLIPQSEGAVLAFKRTF